MQDGDRLVLVTYESGVSIQMRSTVLSPETRQLALQIIDRIYANGSTNLAGGLDTAAAVLLADSEADHFTRRLVLLSDGQANVGETRDAALFAKAGALRERGIGVSAIGVGTDFNATVMEGLAMNGGGRFRFLDNPEEIAVAFAKELRLATRLVASDVEFVLKPGDGTTIEEVYGLVSERRGGDVVVHLPDIALTTQVRVVARLRVDARSGNTPALESAATFTDVGADHVRATVSAPALAVRLAATAGEAVAAVDREVLAQGLNARSIVEARRAMELFEAGKRAEALKALDSTMNAVASANTDLKSKSLLDSLNVFGSLRREYADPSMAAGSERSMMVKRKNIANFGTNTQGGE